MFTTFTSFHHVYLIITTKRVTDLCLVEVRVVAMQAGSAEIWLFLSDPLDHQGVCLVGHGDKVPLGRRFWTRIHPNNTLPDWGDFTQAL